MNTKNIAKPRLRFAVLALLGCSAGYAQTAPQAQDEKPGEQTIVLNEFRVDASKDRGYRATNSISATRLNTPIKDLPVPVEVVTQDFINDIGALDVREALAYSSGIQQDNLFNPLSGGGSPFFTQSEGGASFGPNGTAFRLRGFATRQALREGFRVTSSQDAIDISRVEVVRGPSALLYGVSFLGGVVNIIPKFPLDQQRVELQGTIGSFDLYRFAADVNAARLDLLGGIGNRTNFAFTKRGNWREFDDTDLKQFSHNVSIRPLNWIETNLNIQYTDQLRTGTGAQSFTITDAALRNEYNEPLDIARSLGGKDNRFRWTGDDTFESNEGVLLYGTTNIRPLDWVTLNVGYQWTDNINKGRSINGLQIVNQGTPFANVSPSAYTNTPIFGTGFQTMRFEWGENRTRSNSTQVRTDLKFDFEFWKTKHNLILGRLDIENKSFQKIRGRDTSTPTQGFSYKSPRDFSYFDYDGTGTTPFRDSDFEEWNSGHYAIYSGTFFRRFNLLGGYRFDRYSVRQLQYTYANGLRPATYDESAANQGREFGRPDLAPIKAGYRFNGVPQTYEKPTYGLNVEITPEISAYVLSASGLFPNTGQRNGRGINVNAEESLSKEAGLKVDLWNGKVSGTISGFEIERENAIYFYSFAPSPRNNRPERTGFDPRIPRSFGLDRRVVQAVAALNGQPNYVPPRPVTTFGSAAGANLPTDASWVLNYEVMRGRDSQPGRFGQTAATEAEAKIMRESIESMMRGTLPNGQPLPAGLVASDFLNQNGANWTGNSRGSDVEFDELAKGLDLQLQFRPIENWDILVNYTHLKRTISKGFEFVDFVAEDGTQYGTEYDLWVNRMGGAQNFGDPLRASTFTGAVLVGLQIADVPKHSFTFFNNYTFREGPLKDLSLRAGVIYNTKRPTAVAITGQNLGVNAFPTPDAPARATYNVGLGYRAKFAGHDWRFNLAVDNVLNDQKDEVVVRYTDTTGATVLRRSSVYYTPISFRLTAGIVF